MSPTGEQFNFNAGRLCLDFVNTVRFRPVSDRLELINTYDGLLSWARQATIITPGEAAALAAAARKRGRSAADALSEARALRESIYSIVSSRARLTP